MRGSVHRSTATAAFRHESTTTVNLKRGDSPCVMGLIEQNSAPPSLDQVNKEATCG